MYKLTDKGLRECENYVKELEAKRKEILDAGKDTANETFLPTAEDVFEDALSFGIDDGLIGNGWGVTDHYDADYAITLELGIDFIEVKED